jgi:cobyrinic acid a,c-diamide synthase
VLIAGTHSGAGKTTVATGIMAALSKRGHDVGAAKVGPDFIDPGYHRLATGHGSRNLDTFLSGTALVPSLAARAGEGRDILVIEGVMGLFDGAYGSADGSDEGLADASTALVAALTSTPVILVVDAAAINQSVAALVHGYASFSPLVDVRAVVLNRVASDAHEDALRAALAPLGLPVLGVVRRDPALSWRDRHLGLVPVAERPAEVAAALDALAVSIEAGIDLGAILALARTAPRVATAPLPSIAPRDEGDRVSPTKRPVIAIAGGPAFTFVYPDNLERLQEAGAELASFDPLIEAGLPPGANGVYAGGGFPEVYAEQLAANEPMLASVALAARSGLPIWAECGGLLWLSESLDGHRLCGAVAARASMTGRLNLGYRTAQVRVDNPVSPAGQTLRGHEFHYSTVEPGGDALLLASHRDSWLEGFASPSLLATYLHVHLAAEPWLAERFVKTCATVAARAARS